MYSVGLKKARKLGKRAGAELQSEKKGKGHWGIGGGKPIREKNGR